MQDTHSLPEISLPDNDPRRRFDFKLEDVYIRIESEPATISFEDGRVVEGHVFVFDGEGQLRLVGDDPSEIKRLCLEENLNTRRVH